MAFRSVLKLSELIADRLIGAFIATAETGQRWELSRDDIQNTIFAYTGNADESSPAQILVRQTHDAGPPTADYGILELFAPGMAGVPDGPPGISMSSQDDYQTGIHRAEIDFTADTLTMFGVAAAIRVTLGGRLDISDALQVGFGTAVTHAMDFGGWSGTTNASGLITIPHNLGIAPVHAEAVRQFGTGARYIDKVTSRTASNIVIQVVQSTGTIAPSGEVHSGTYFAIG